MQQRHSTKIVIGIQARSTSTRFPRKVHELIGGKTVLTRVIESCQGSAAYLSKYFEKTNNSVSVTAAMCIPTGDEIENKYYSAIPVIEGPEHDVLGRYMILANKLEADYIVRITSDCPLIPQRLISEHVITAFKFGYDYLSNVDEECRTAIDGMDCEVISYRILKDTDARASTSSDREHVTTLIRRDPPRWASVGFSMTHVDHSEIKLSIDTPEDLDRIRQTLIRTQEKHRRARYKYGEKRVHWF